MKPLMKPVLHFAVLAFAGVALPCINAAAADFEVGQKDNAFSTRKLAVKSGDSVSFRNLDPNFHNVFSLSEGQSFDLGSYPQGQSKKVTFTKPGTVEIEC